MQDASDEASRHSKLFAITEGNRELNKYPLAGYWMDGYLDVIKGDTKVIKSVYGLVWLSPTWGPVVGRSDADSFDEMMDDPYIKTISPETMLGIGTQED